MIRAAGFGGLCFVLLLAVSTTWGQKIPASGTVRRGAMHYGPFMAGGVGTGEASAFSFLNAGAQVGFVLTPKYGPGVLKGNFEVGAEAIPFWQSYAPHRTYRFVKNGVVSTFTGGGTYTGIALTPLILRWNFAQGQSHFVPWAQGAGGLVYTTRKYPIPGTSVWNFEPQFGIGAHYFVNYRHSIDFAANAIHISNASLGDRNPGINALVQFQLGYTWWKK
jgi:hypothetical protein